MAKPLFEKSELIGYRERSARIGEKYILSGNWNESWAEREALDRAIQIETVRRVKERVDEYLNALLMVIGNRGGVYIAFDRAFVNSDYSEYLKVLKRVDIPENRRILHTILKALTQIPKSWARSAFVRFLRGTGKQKKAKYYGAGSLGPQYGWTEREVTGVCEVIAGDTNPYAKVLMSYADVPKEIQNKDPDFEIVDHDVQFKATCVERDIEFLHRLCQILENRGLAEVPDIKERKKTKPHVPKIFKSGDIIRKGNLRDLPLPAYVRIPIERFKGESQDVTPDFLERVVLGLGNGGQYRYAQVRSGVAYQDRQYMDIDYKSHLYGATYIGPWKDRIEKGKELKINFRFRFLSR